MNNSAKHTEATRAVDYKELKVTSPAFKNLGGIPLKYTCDGLNISPPLDIDNIPINSKSLVIIADDPDAPIRSWVHWIVWNIPVTHHIKENDVHGSQGINDFQQQQYGGPCNPSGRHRYFFKVYALDSILDLPADTRKHLLEKTMSQYVIGFGQLVGFYHLK